MLKVLNKQAVPKFWNRFTSLEPLIYIFWVKCLNYGNCLRYKLFFLWLFRLSWINFCTMSLLATFAVKHNKNSKPVNILATNNSDSFGMEFDSWTPPSILCAGRVSVARFREYTSLFSLIKGMPVTCNIALPVRHRMCPAQTFHNFFHSLHSGSSFLS